MEANISQTLERPTTMPLETEISAYEAMEDTLRSLYAGKFVIFHGSQFISAHSSFDEAAEKAVKEFGRGPYLIRQVGAPDLTLPASVVFHFQNAHG